MLQPNQTINIRKCEISTYPLFCRMAIMLPPLHWRTIIVSQSFHPPRVLAPYISFCKIVTSSGIFSENCIFWGLKRKCSSTKKQQLNRQSLHSPARRRNTHTQMPQLLCRSTWKMSVCSVILPYWLSCPVISPSYRSTSLLLHQRSLEGWWPLRYY